MTVVIPTLNEERTIGSCLTAVHQEQEAAAVVSDGGSSDRTLELVGEFQRTRVVQGTAGRGQQLNRGAAVAESELMLFLHADCVLPAGWMHELVGTLANPGVALACFRLRTLRSAGDSSSRVRAAWLRLLDLRSFGMGLPYGDQGFGLRRSTFDQLGGFQEIPLMEDLAMARACRRLGSIGRIPLAVRTTARRFERHPLRTRLMTIAFPWLYRVGVSPWRLARWYQEVR